MLKNTLYIIMSLLFITTTHYARFIQPTVLQHMRHTATKYITYIREVYHNDGSGVTSQTIYFPDGSKKIVHSNGTYELIDAEGKKEKLGLYNDVTKGYEYGANVTEYSDGSTEYHHPEDND